MTDTYRIARVNIGVSSLYEEVHLLCVNYRSSVTVAQFTVSSDQPDIDFKREKFARENEAEGISVWRHSDGYPETPAVYRKIAEKMPDYDTFLFHGSCVAVDGEGYLFAAKSGVGKSTHAHLWRELLGDRAVMFSDNEPLIRVTDAVLTTEVMVVGIPEPPAPAPAQGVDMAGMY